MSNSANPQVQPRRRVIGPVPPRCEKTGKMLLKPFPGPSPVVNPNGMFQLDAAGNQLFEERDQRNGHDYMAYNPAVNYEPEMLDGSCKGLSVFEVTHDDENSTLPTMLLWARDHKHAVLRFRQESGAIRFAPAENQTFAKAQVTRVSDGKTWEVPLTFNQQGQLVSA